MTKEEMIEYFKEHKEEIMKVIDEDIFVNPYEVIKEHINKNK